MNFHLIFKFYFRSIAFLFLHLIVLIIGQFSTLRASQEVLDHADIPTVVAVIKNEIPDLTIDSIILISTGWDNLVADINDDWIFRFPRSKAFQSTLNREIWLLDRLKDKVSIQIPHYEYIGSDYAFVGYRKIKGESLDKELYLTLPETLRQGIAESLALFLSQLHASVTVEEAFEKGYEEYHVPLQWIEYSLVDSLPTVDMELMVYEALQYVKEHSFERARLVLVHNDLHGGNLAFDTTTNCIAGVFDFSDAVVGDYSIEFGKLFCIHADLAKRTAEAYALISQVENPLEAGAADYILRRASYILNARENGDIQREKVLMHMLEDFVPVWNELMRQ